MKRENMEEMNKLFNAYILLKLNQDDYLNKPNTTEEIKMLILLTCQMASQN